MTISSGSLFSSHPPFGCVPRSPSRFAACALAVSLAGWAIPGRAQEQPKSPQEPSKSATPPKNPQEAPSAKQTQASGTETSGKAGATNTDLDDIADKPDSYVGKRVTVQSEVEEILDPRAFTLDEDSVMATHDVLVLLPKPTTASIGSDAELRITGTVRKLDRTTFKQDYSWFDFAPALLKDYEKHATIIADSVMTKEGKPLMTQGTAASGKEEKKNPGKKEAQAATQVTAGAIARDPASHYGRRVSVQSEIEDVYGLDRTAFTLDEDALFAGPDLLVITAQSPAAVQEGGHVRVTGTLRPFTWTEIRRDFDWLELDNDLVVAFESRPVLVADSISRARAD